MSSPAYRLAKQAYAAQGVDTEAAIRAARRIPISLHCWQADDVRGLETPKEGLTGSGTMATGGYPGRARNGDEMRADLDLALKLLPGKQRLNLHAFYAETGSKVVDRDEIGPEHFARWTSWAKSRRVGLDFNPTYFNHEMANSGFTLSDANPAVRKFWINHAKACALADGLAKLPGVELVTPAFFNEFTIRLSKPAAPIVDALAQKGILAGVPASRLLPDGGVDDLLILAATECVTDDDMTALADALKELV